MMKNNKTNTIGNSISFRSRSACCGKKGISAIVATVLIILITVAAVTIIWAAIIPMITNELGGATECFDASAALTVLSDFSCYEDSATAADVTAYSAVTAVGVSFVKIQIGRTAGDFDLKGIDVSGSYQGSSDTVKFNSTTTDKIPVANGARVYAIMVNTTTTSDRDFKLDGIDAASVSARVKSGQTERLCDGSAVTTIRACS